MRYILKYIPVIFKPKEKVTNYSVIRIYMYQKLQDFLQIEKNLNGIVKDMEMIY